MCTAKYEGRGTVAAGLRHWTEAKQLPRFLPVVGLCSVKVLQSATDLGSGDRKGSEAEVTTGQLSCAFVDQQRSKMSLIAA